MFEFSVPTKVYQTPDLGSCVAAILQQAGARQVGVMLDEQLLAAPPVLELLGALEDKVRVERYPHHATLPTTALVDAYARALRKRTPEFLLAIGGGTTLDLAKAVAALTLSEGSIEVYQGTGRRLGASIPTIMVPTTAGTGCEVSSVALLVHEATSAYQEVSAPSMAPRFAVLAPTLLSSLPQSLRAAEGLVAFAHAVEAWLSPRASPLTRVFALEAIKHLWRSLPVVVEAPGDLVAQGEVQLAATLAGIALENSTRGLVSTVGHSVALLAPVPFAQVIARALPALLRELCCASALSPPHASARVWPGSSDPEPLQLEGTPASAAAALQALGVALQSADWTGNDPSRSLDGSRLASDLLEPFRNAGLWKCLGEPMDVFGGSRSVRDAAAARWMHAPAVQAVGLTQPSIERILDEVGAVR